MQDHRLRQALDGLVVVLRRERHDDVQTLASARLQPALQPELGQHCPREVRSLLQALPRGPRHLPGRRPSGRTARWAVDVPTQERSALLRSIGTGRARVDEAKASVIQHFTSARQKSAHRSTVERAAKADPAHTGRLQRFDAERLTGPPDHEVDRPRHGRADFADRFQVRQPWREQHIRTDGLEGLQAPDRVVEIEDAAHEVLSPGR